ncbi:chromosome segregation protein SMC [Thermodesulfovibrio yellowstonii]|uniref:chromosome segregation protein SMC n=1 Tax=Thermodesulfovibrio yellowstonii TaxID=28262 RepID=UPI0024B37029|nr:chromosome segregation protein SMC [Thermodesulfovibrio yellowstonii]MDI6864496.1 chromosome segregation protein SMC [Thermodesulfovibrio yellowstonii]
MRIKWIELNGFKSFPERTKIELNEGITCFVGPNGAGKSNIIDAFRWVLGEHNPRILRGEKMEEVIFQGTFSKKEKGLAEVTLLLNIKKESTNGNDPEIQEVEVKRRLYRTGESYFSINGKQSRLKDIKEIFISEGVDIRTYSIIDQMKINEILFKSSQRKSLLEECAGISLYKLKKTESETKLQSAKENLQRIEDILNELKKQYSLLERQAKKADKYRKAMEELKDTELKVSKTEVLNLLSVLQKLKTEIENLENKQSKLKEENGKIIEKINHQKKYISEIEITIQERDNQIKQGELEKAKIEKELALLAQEELNKKEQIKKLGEENTSIHDEIDEAQQELKNCHIQSEEIEKLIDFIQKEIISEEENLLALQKEIVEIEKLIEKQRKTLFNLTTELANKRNNYQSIKKSLEQVQNRISNIEIRKKEIYQKIRQMETEVKNREIKIKSLKDTYQEEIYKINVLKQQLSEAEGLFESQSQILLEKKKTEAIINGKIEALSSEIWEEDNKHKLFFECIDVSPEVEELVEIFLDDKLKASIIDKIEEIEGVQHKKFFFLKNYNQTKAESPNLPGIKKIKDFLQIKDSEISSEIFENLFIVDSLKEALEKRRAYPQYSFITTKGEIIFSDGFIKVGKPTDLLKKKRMLEDLKAEKNKLIDDIKSIEEEINRIRAKREELKKEIEEKRAHITQLNKEIFQTEERYKTFLKDIEQTKQRLKYMENEEKIIQDEINQNTKLKEEVYLEIQNLSLCIEELETKIEELKNEQKEILNKNDVQKEAVSNKKIELSTLKEKLNSKKIEIKRLNEHLKTISIKKLKNEEEIEQNKKRINQIEYEKAERIKNLENLNAEINSLKEQRESLLEKLQNEKSVLTELEKSYQRLNEELQSITALLGEKKTIEGENKIKLENIWNEIYTLYGVDIIKEEFETVQEIEQLKIRITQLKNQLRDIGPVDVDILREYEEVRERYEFLLNQQEDIKTSIKELEEAIRKINSLTRRKLKETFDLLKDKFNNTFQELFGGGKAEIILTDEINILDSEIDIFVQPPGKKSNSINLLSGGEKTLAAIAFVFACLSIRPSPICIFDEIDAPLDDPNILRFRKLIKDLSSKTQFLIITHNKLMMECADYIYGITMQEEGISTVISLGLKEAEVYA